MSFMFQAKVSVSSLIFFNYWGCGCGCGEVWDMEEWGMLGGSRGTG